MPRNGGPDRRRLLQSVGVAMALGAMGTAVGTATPSADGTASTRESETTSSDGEISVDSTDGELSGVPDVDITASGSGTVGNVRLSGGTGTMEIEGADADTVVYERIPWEAAGYTLYQCFSVAGDGIYVSWVYADYDSGAVTDIWIEGVDGPSLESMNASGEATLNESSTTVSVQFPSATVSRPDRNAEYAVWGSGVELGTARNRMVGPSSWPDPFAGTELEAVVFETVDCSDCPGGPWHELHMVLLPETQDSLAFGILYLYPDTSNADLLYVIGVPELFSDAPGDFDVEWERLDQLQSIFVVSELAAERVTVQEGKTAKLSATVSNQGNSSDERTVSWDLDGKQIAQKDVSIGAGGSTEVTAEHDTSGLDTGEWAYSVTTAEDTATGTLVVESPSVEHYANDEGVVDTAGMRDSIDDWRDGAVETGLLRDVIDAWRSGEPVR